MIWDSSYVPQMTDQTIARLFQQLQNEITALDEVTASLINGAAVNTQMHNGSDSQHDERHSFAIAPELVGAVEQLILPRKQALHQLVQELQQRTHQLETLYTIAGQYGDDTNTSRVLTTAMDAMWAKIPLRFLVAVLGESELGPYHYHALRGVANAWQYVNSLCPFPLWGVLARAMLPRLSPDEPDFFVIKDIANENLPLSEEFPWMPRSGSLMIVPLRVDNRARGAFLLGSKQVNGFTDMYLREDVLAIAYQSTRVLELAQMNQELNERAGQLLSLQLFTKSITTAHNYDKLVDVLLEGIFEALGHVGVSILVGEQSWHRQTDGSTTVSDNVRRIIDWAMQAGQPIFYDPNDSEGSIERFYYNESGYALVVPILRNERTQGAIQITTDGTRRFEEGDMIVLRTIANCAAIILRDFEILSR